MKNSSRGHRRRLAVDPLRNARAAIWGLLVLAAGMYAGHLTQQTITGGPGRQLGVRIDRALQQGAGFAPFDPATIARLRAEARRDPLDGRNLRLLSTAAAARGKPAESNKLLYLANHITRRELFTQLAMIEDGVARGDVRSALDHHAIALTISRRADPALLPVLTGALAEPDVRADLARRIRAAPMWRDRFLDYAVASAPPAFVAPLLIGWRSDADDMHRFQAMLLDRYVARRDYAGAFSFGMRIGGPDARELATAAPVGKRRDPRFSPLAWQLTDDGDIQTLAQEGRLRITVSPDARGTAASLLLLLDPGRYVLTQRFKTDSASGVQATWDWRCLRTDGALPPRTADIPLREGLVTTRITLDVPVGCAAMQLSIRVAADASATTSDINVDQIDIRPHPTAATSVARSRKVALLSTAVTGRRPS